MRIFIGSSGESVKNGLLEEVKSMIENASHQALPWNLPGLFPPGEHTYSVLREISHSVDGAIFLFSEDDKLWYRTDSMATPRDNVLIEYGLFSAALDPKRAIICRAGKPKMASDIAGLTFIDLTDKKRAAEEIDIWLKALPSYYDSLEYKLSIYDNKYNVPGNNQFWRDLPNKAKDKFHLLGETNKSWIGRDAAQTEQFGLSIINILDNGGEVSIYCSKKKTIVNQHIKFIGEFVVNPILNMDKDKKEKLLHRFKKHFRFCYGPKLNYQAVISDDRIVVLPLVNTSLFKEESIVFEMHDEKHSRLFEFYANDIYRTVAEYNQPETLEKLIEAS